MNVYEAMDEADLVDSLILMLEKDSGKKIFTMRILEHVEDGLEALVIFEDKNVMMGKISVGSMQGKLAVRLQGNYI